MYISWRTFFLMLWLPLSLAANPALAGDSAAPMVKTANGVLQGVLLEDGVRVFRGIPYALPPEGELRWREPQPVPHWKGVRLAEHFGDRSMQPTLWKDMIFRSDKMSEDCLYLNVWTPPVTKRKALPVLVYFHGGGLVAGDGSELRYDGASFARLGIVVVTVNYRLGVFGCLAHPELTRESPRHASGNYGYLDQNAALRWVRTNIAAFGGDPLKVTIAGQSAGAFSVSAHMASPLSRGLFRAAIAQSGSLLGNDKLKPLAVAEQAGEQFATKLGAHSLAELRQIPADRLLQASQGTNFDKLKSILDGYFFPEQPQEIFSGGRQAKVPLLAGWTSTEVDYHSLLKDETPTVEHFIRKVRELYGAQADEVLTLYPASNDAEALKSATDLGSDRFVAFRTWKLTDMQAKNSGQPVYRYLWGQIPPREKGAPAPPPDISGPLGARHSSDLPYTFGALKLIPGIEWTPADYQASAALQGYFANFIKSGNPNGGGLPSWPQFQAGDPHVMAIEAAPHVIAAPGTRRYQFLDDYQVK